MTDSNTELEKLIREVANQERKPLSDDQRERLEELLDY